MARQFREQLEEEVQLEEARRTAQERAAPETRTPPPTPAEAAAATPPPAAAESAPATPEPERPPNYSHAQPTDETGALATGTADLSPGANERRP
jgi:hypothetical protein